MWCTFGGRTAAFTAWGSNTPSTPGTSRSVTPLITAAELDATRARVDALLASGVHPEPTGEWPAIPWPPV